jgi:hypothetical protein
MADLSSILAMLGLGGQQPAPAQQPQGQPPPGGQPSAMPSAAQPSGVESFLNNPLLQGAASAYLGTIASPRREHLSARLAQGGLEGLGAYNQAETNQLRMPLLRAQIEQELAKLPLLQAQTQSSQARAKLEGAQAAQYAPNPEMADHFRVLANDPQASPTQRQIYGMLADGVGAGSIKVEDAAKAAANEDVAGARTLLAQAQTQKAEADISLTPYKQQALQAETSERGADISLTPYKQQALQAETSERGAQGALAGAKIGEVPAEEANLAARTSEAEAQANLAKVTAAGGKPGSVTEQQKNVLTEQAQLQKNAEAAWAARPLTQKAMSAAGEGTDHEAFIQNYIALHSVPQGTSHTSASGKPMTMGPDGHWHYNE